MKSVLDENGLIRNLETAELKKLVNDEADAYISLLFKDKYPPTKRLIHLFDRVKRLTVIIAVDLYAEICKSDFIPSFFEMGIGEKNNPVLPPYEIKLNDGSSVSFSGVVDRVDLFKKDDKVYVRVIDYKTGTKKFNIDDIKQGLNLQMLIYLFAICNSNSEKLRKKINAESAVEFKPAGITYISTNVSPKKTSRNISEEEIIDMVSKKFTREGLILNDEEILTALNKDIDKRYLAGIERVTSKSKKDTAPAFTGNALTTTERFDEIKKQITDTLTDIIGELASGNASISPMLDQKPCKYCKMKQFCRVELSDVQRIEDDDNSDDDEYDN